MSRLSAVIVDFHSAPLTARLARLLREEAGRSAVELEIVVVENGSTADEARALREIDGIRLVSPGGNRGYAGGLNDGIAASRGELLLLLNPDLEPRAGFLPPLLREIESPGVGAAGPRFTWDRDDRWLLPPLEIPGLAGELGRVRSRRAGRPDERLRRRWLGLARRHWEAERPIDSDGLVGAAILVARDTLERVGVFDEQFPLYFEDTDWFLRLARTGLRARYVPTSIVRHLAGRSAAADPGEAERRFLESEARFRRKHWSGLARVALRLFAMRRATGPAPQLPIATAAPRYEWSGGPESLLVEISPLVEMTPSAGRFVHRGESAIDESFFRELPSGNWYVRGTDRTGDSVVFQGGFRKT